MIRPPSLRRGAVAAAAIVLTSAGAAAAPSRPFEIPADVVRAEGGRPLAAARSDGPAATLKAALAARGRDAATLATLHETRSHLAPNGVRHVFFEQRIDGLVVQGTYVKAAFDRAGNLVHVVDGSRRIPAAGAGIAPARATARDALRAALAQLHPRYDSGALRETGTAGSVTSFDGGAFFDTSPTVTATLVPAAGGTLARGWVVQTWTARTNQLHYTLVGGDGAVLAIDRRTHDDAYNVFTISPGQTPQAVVQGPGPGGNASSPMGWLTGPWESTTLITGNNVSAYLDADANDAPDLGVGSRTTSQQFLASADLAAQPNAGANRDVAVQNLFYLTNRVHDILYAHGFTESAGNFQADNFGKGGVGGDPVRAEAQDGGGLSNANFATPQDGFRPRMQMYLFQNRPTVELAISTPAPATYDGVEAEFGPRVPAGGVSGNVLPTTPADGCTAIATALAGSIALIDRGSCDFSLKTLNAQQAGAIGVVVANNQGGTTVSVMGAGQGADQVNIPAVMISQNAGAAVKATASPAGTLRRKEPQPLMRDGSLDSDLVYHEYGHGLTHRMIGNALFAMSGPLAGAIGEGGGDTLAMLINGDDVIAEYATESPTGFRRAPYANYPLTYGDVTGAEVHADGEIYAAIMWRLIELFGPDRRATLFDYWVDGMNYTRIQPKFENMRDGMLESVAQGATPADRCTIWSAFAQYGVGVGASGVVNGDFSVTITPSFAKPADCL